MRLISAACGLVLATLATVTVDASANMRLFAALGERLAAPMGEAVLSTRAGRRVQRRMFGSLSRTRSEAELLERLESMDFRTAEDFYVRMVRIEDRMTALRHDPAARSRFAQERGLRNPRNEKLLEIIASEELALEQVRRTIRQRAFGGAEVRFVRPASEPVSYAATRTEFMSMAREYSAGLESAYTRAGEYLERNAGLLELLFTQTSAGERIAAHLDRARVIARPASRALEADARYMRLFKLVSADKMAPEAFEIAYRVSRVRQAAAYLEARGVSVGQRQLTAMLEQAFRVESSPYGLRYLPIGLPWAADAARGLPALFF